MLLLCDDSRHHASNVREHIGAFGRHSRHHIDVYNPRGVKRPRQLDWADYDVVVIHYTLVAARDEYLSPTFREAIARFPGPKIQFIQDEYRWVDEMTGAMRELGTNLLYSLVPQETVPQVYGGRLDHVEVKTTLAGFVPDQLSGSALPPLTEREFDVVYRGRPVPYWLGRLGQDKVTIGREFRRRSAGRDLRTDIAWGESDRIYGEDWYRFLAASRTTLGTESGASIVDFDGSIHDATETYMSRFPTASFHEVERDVLIGYEGNATINVISPRVFEAAALGTAMINFTGRYSDIIEPWVHYLPLEKDFSNFELVVEQVRDDEALAEIRSRAYEDLIASERYSLATFIAEFDSDVDRLTPAHAGGRRAPGPRTTQSSPGDGESAADSGEARSAAHLDAVESGLLQAAPEVQAAAEAAHALLGEGRQFARVRNDLIRLAIMVLAQRGKLGAVSPDFRTEARLERGAELWFVSHEPAAPADPRSMEEAPSEEPSHATVLDAIGRGGLEGIFWNHTAIGSTVVFASGGELTPIFVGHYVTSGVHRFDAFLQLAPSLPATVDAVLCAALEPPAKPPAIVWPTWPTSSSRTIRRIKLDRDSPPHRVLAPCAKGWSNWPAVTRVPSRYTSCCSRTIRRRIPTPSTITSSPSRATRVTGSASSTRVISRAAEPWISRSSTWWSSTTRWSSSGTTISLPGSETS